MNPIRLRIVVVLLVIGAASVVLRAAQISVLQNDRWSRKARDQHEDLVTASGARGDIRSADGYVLATSVERVAIQVDTHLLAYPEPFARAVAPLLGDDEGDILRRLQRGPRSVWLAQQLPREVGDEIRDLEPMAVFEVPDSERVYPLGTLASPVLGFVGREELRTVGRSGFEHYYDALLAGEPDTFLVLKDGIPRRVRLERVHEGRAGIDLELTLNARLQAACEAELEATIEAQRGSGGSAVVLEAHTGAVLALASVPTFDPADPPADSRRWRLRPVQDALEPGSTVKPLIAAAAVAAGAVHDGDLFDCRHHGSRIAGFWIRDHAEPGIYSLPDVIAHSANAGIIEIAERTPPTALWRALDAFGFGRPCGLGFPAEASGILQPPERWSKLSAAGLALGQELTTSPLQLAVAYGAVANGGWLLRPRLFARGPHHASLGRETSADGVRVLDSQLAREIRRWMERVVTDGTGSQARVAGYPTAGKTGTAQRAVNGTFDDIHHTSWFAGFFPVDEPRLVIVVSIEDPRGDYWASSVAAPVFARIVEAAASILDLAPVAEPGLAVRVADSASPTSERGPA